MGMEDLGRVLEAFNEESGAEASAVVSRSGVPIAWALPASAHADNFGTMTATLLGALEVIYSGMNRPSPARIVVDADGAFLVARALTPQAFLVAMTERLTPEFEQSLDEAAGRVREVLGPES